MFLSIIIPVYNLENHIKDCLECCLKQDFDDYEILCVNDGSKDSSPVILDDYAENYPNKIRVIHKENGGVSSARNVGIANAKGKWIWFVDGDDTIAIDCIGKAAKLLTKVSSCECFSFQSAKVFTPTILKASDEVKASLLEKEELFNFSTDNSAVWTHWLLREIISQNNMTFDSDMKYAEDTSFMFRYKSLIKCEIATNAVFYYYYQRGDSAMHNIDHINHMKCMKKLVDTCHDAFLNTDCSAAKRYYKRRRTVYVKMFMWDMLLYKQDYNKIREEITSLEVNGIYPYKEVSKKVRGRNIKETVVKALSLTFKYKAIYFLLCKTTYILKKMRGKK